MNRGTRWSTDQYKQLREKLQAGKKTGKFGNQYVEIDGIWFQSIKEGEYYKGLRTLKAAGAITSFRLQVEYNMIVKGLLICKYIADFVVQYPDGHTEIVDVKGIKTPVFKLKAKLMIACHGIEIKIV